MYSGEPPGIPLGGGYTNPGRAGEPGYKVRNVLIPERSTTTLLPKKGIFKREHMTPEPFLLNTATHYFISFKKAHFLDIEK